MAFDDAPDLALSPEAAVERFVSARQAGQWAAAAAFLEPTPTRQWVHQRRAAYVAWVQGEDDQYSEWLQVPQDTPPAVVEWLTAAAERERSQRPSQPPEAFARVDSVTTLMALSAPELLERMIEATARRAEFVRVLGSVPDDASIAHVVIRRRPTEVAWWGPAEVIEAVRGSDGGWRLVPLHPLTLLGESH